MKIEEAIRVLKNSAFLSTVSSYQAVEEAVEIAVNALEKQIPKSPVKSKTPRYGMGYKFNDWECPRCGAFIALEPDIVRLTKVHHCKCGQRLLGEGEVN